MLTSVFRPPRWLRSPHLQTLGGAVPLYAPPRSHTTEDEEVLRIPLDDGGDHFLHALAWWARGSAWRHGASPAVLIVHGIAGSKESLCCIRAAVAAHRAGYHAIRLDMRGAGASVEHAPTLYHGGLTSDVDLVVRHLLADRRVSSLLVLGFSGGGSIALKLAGEWGSDAPAGVGAVASISAPLDYIHVGARMDSLACLPYRYHVLGGLIDRARAFSERHPERVHYRPTDLIGLKRFRTYDDAVIVPMHGFDSVDHYYRAVSSGPWLGKIRVPALLLHAEDDPMVPIAGVRPWLDGASKSVRIRLSRHGGHIGWLGGLDESSWIKGWATSEALAFFAEHAPTSTTLADG